MGELWLPRGRGVQSTGLDLSYSSWMSSKICKIWWAVSAVKVLHARLWGRSVDWHDCGVSHSGWVMGLIDTAVECHIQAGWWVSHLNHRDNQQQLHTKTRLPFHQKLPPMPRFSSSSESLFSLWCFGPNWTDHKSRTSAQFARHCIVITDCSVSLKPRSFSASYWAEWGC